MKCIGQSSLVTLCIVLYMNGECCVPCILQLFYEQPKGSADWRVRTCFVMGYAIYEIKLNNATGSGPSTLRKSRSCIESSKGDVANFLWFFYVENFQTTTFQLHLFWDVSH